MITQGRNNGVIWSLSGRLVSITSIRVGQSIIVAVLTICLKPRSLKRSLIYTLFLLSRQLQLTSPNKIISLFRCEMLFNMLANFCSKFLFNCFDVFGGTIHDSD